MSLTGWADLRTAARADCVPAEVIELVQLHLDNGYAPPLELEVDGVLVRLVTERNRLVLYHAGRRHQAAAYRKTSRTGERAQTRSVYLPDWLYEAVCRLGEPAEVMRTAIRDYVERHTAPAAPGGADGPAETQVRPPRSRSTEAMVTSRKGRGDRKYRGG